MIKSRLIRSTNKIRSYIGEMGTFRFSVKAMSHAAKLEQIGLSILTERSILPSPVGKISHFNANGKEIVRKDLPKQQVSKMVWGTWRDWQGGVQSGLQNRKFLAYPREWVPAPEEHISVINGSESILAVSRPFKTDITSNEELLHVANLFLEIFGEFSIIDGESLTNPAEKIRHLNWTIIPPGEHPFERGMALVNSATDATNDESKKIVQYRISKIKRHKPDFIAIGNGGFSGYIVFGFSQKNIFVLESPIFGNATYVFKKDWETVSRLTKKEIINAGLHAKRIMHTKGWDTELALLLI